MTLKTSLIITGDATGGVQAVDSLTASLDKAGTAAREASTPMVDLDNAQKDTASSAREGAGAATELDAAQRKAAGSTRELAQATDTTKATQTAVAGAAREAADAQQAYGEALTKAAEGSGKLTAANDDVKAGAAAVKEQLAGIEGAQTAAASGADAHKAAMAGLDKEIGAIVAQITGGTSVFDAMAERGNDVAAALQKVAQASGVATDGIGAAGTAGTEAGADLGALGAGAVDVAGKVKDTGTKFSAVAGILSGPWGAAAGLALSFLAPLVAKIIESKTALDDEVTALKENATKTDIARQAKEAFGKTEAGIAADVRALTADLDRQNEALKTNAERQNIRAKDDAARLTKQRDDVAAKLAAAQKALDTVQQSAPVTFGGAESRAYSQRLSDATAEVSTLQTQLKSLNGDIASAQTAIERTRVALAAENAKAVGDAVAGINKKYDAEIARLTETKNREIALNKTIGAQTQRQFEDIERRRKADIATEEERQRKKITPRPASLGSQVQNDQAAEIYRTAQRYGGLSENKAGDRDQLRELFAKANGQTIDPRITAWCAAFVNAVLATDGIKGTGSLAARSFLNFGEATNKPVQGDVVVSKRGNDATQGHVGFYQGTDAKGRVLVLGGNTGDKVGTQAIARSDVLGFRRAPSAADQFGAESKAAADALKEQAKDLEEVTTKYLPAVAAAKEYADELERIDRLAKSYDPAKAGSGLSPAEVAQAKAAVTAARDKRLADLNMTPEAKAADQARKSIDGVVGSLQREVTARQTLDPVQRAMIEHQDELAKLSDVEREAYERKLKSLYAQDEAYQAVEEATRAAAQAQEQFRSLALDAFDAIVVGGQNAGDVIKRLAQTIASAAIEASVFGTGPIAALLKSGGVMHGGGGTQAASFDAELPGLGGGGNQTVADIIGKSVGKNVGDKLDGVFGRGNGAKALQNAGIGYAAGNVTGSGIGGSIGGLIGGQVAGKLLSSALGSFAGPLGSIAGGLLGGVVGKLFAGKEKPGGVTVSVSGGEAGVSGTVGSNKAGQSAGNTLGGQVASTVNQIVSQLGGTLGNFSVQIGKYKDDLRVNVNGKALGGVKNSGAVGFGDDQNAAVSYAAAQAIAQGAVQGVSAAVAKALQSSTDIDKALKEALKVQDIELLVGGIGAEVDKAFKDFEATAKERVRIAQQYGFDVIAIEKRNAEDRAKLADELMKKQVGSLQTLIDEITRGDLFEGSALDKIAAINDAIAKARTDLDAGVEGAGDTLANLYSQRLAASKDAYGTTSGYAADRASTLDEARAAVAKANARITQANTATSDPALATTNAALDENNDQNARILAALTTNNTLLTAIAKNNDYSPRLFDLNKLAAY